MANVRGRWSGQQGDGDARWEGGHIAPLVHTSMYVDLTSEYVDLTSEPCMYVDLTSELCM
jgi:hypothetical protein